MSSKQYLVYTALVLGSIGTYGALNNARDADSTLEALISGENVSSADLASILESLNSRLSAVETSKSYEPRLGDVELVVDRQDGEITTLDTQVGINTTDISDFNTSLSEEIGINTSAISGNNSALSVLNSTVVDTVQVDVSDLQADVGDLITFVGAKLSLTGEISTEGLSLDERISAIEKARGLEALATKTLSESVTTNAGDITDNFNSIGDIEEDISLVHAPEIKNNKDGIESVVGDLKYITDVFTRVVDVDEGVDEMVCYNKLNARGGAELALNNSYLRLSASSDDAYMLYRSNISPSGHNFGSNACRMRVFNSASEGFVVENSNDEVLLTVRGDGYASSFQSHIQVDGAAFVGQHLYSGDGNTACLGYEDDYAFMTNRSYVENERGFRQFDDGIVSLGSPTAVTMNVDGVERLRVSSGRLEAVDGITIHQEDTSVPIKSTYFNYSGSNYISCKEGGSTYFRNGTSIKVSIEDKEIFIDGTGVLAKLNQLQSEIDNLHKTYDTRYVRAKDGDNTSSEYIIEGHNDNWSKYLSYSGDDARWKNTTMRVRLRPAN